MSNLIKSESGKVAKSSRRKPKDQAIDQVTPKEVESYTPETETINLVSTGDIVKAAVTVSDAQKVIAQKAYNQRTAENTQELFTHIQETGQNIYDAVLGQIQDVYGLSLTDIYGEENAAQIEAE